MGGLLGEVTLVGEPSCSSAHGWHLLCQRKYCTFTASHSCIDVQEQDMIGVCPPYYRYVRGCHLSRSSWSRSQHGLRRVGDLLRIIGRMHPSCCVHTHSHKSSSTPEISLGLCRNSLSQRCKNKIDLHMHASMQLHPQYISSRGCFAVLRECCKT